MRRKRNVIYTIINYSGYWWVNKTWMKSDEVNKLKSYHSCSSGAFARTIKKAKKIALKCPAEMIIIKRFYKKGIPYEQEIIVKAVENEKLSGM
jgi:tRNA U55 pseudouridine synthase TruB